MTWLPIVLSRLICSSQNVKDVGEVVLMFWLAIVLSRLTCSSQNTRSKLHVLFELLRTGNTTLSLIHLASGFPPAPDFAKGTRFQQCIPVYQSSAALFDHRWSQTCKLVGLLRYASRFGKRVKSRERCFCCQSGCSGLSRTWVLQTACRAATLSSCLQSGNAFQRKRIISKTNEKSEVWILLI